MINRIRSVLTTLMVSGFVFVPGLIPAVVYAAAPSTFASSVTGSLCTGASLQVSGNGVCSDTSGTLDSVIKFVLNLFSVIVGITAVIMIVIGGFKYIISGGDSTKVSGAKDTILFAIVGLVIVALAQVIVHFVLHNLPGQVSGGS